MPKKKTTKKAKKTTADADSLRNALAETIDDLRSKRIDATTANSIASQTREICRITKTQLDVLKFVASAKGAKAKAKDLLL